MGLGIGNELRLVIKMVLDGLDAQGWDRKINNCVEISCGKTPTACVVFGSAFVCDLFVFLKQLAPHSRVIHHTPRASEFGIVGPGVRRLVVSGNHQWRCVQK
jgi:hypothetical protein